MESRIAYTGDNTEITGQFNVVSQYRLAGDQPQAVQSLVNGLRAGKRDQVLFGITGSGKTFAMANVIAQVGRPALVIVHNKTLAMQVYEEMKELFPHNAVEYFVSYYDYYQPEVYVPGRDLYIEKDAAVNEHIDTMRHSATRSLFERRDVIIVSSISCLYGLGTAEDYHGSKCVIEVGGRSRVKLSAQLSELQYKCDELDEGKRGTFNIKENAFNVFPSHMSDRGWKVTFEDEEIVSIVEFDRMTGAKFSQQEKVILYPNTHHMSSGKNVQGVIDNIKRDLSEQIASFKARGMMEEAARIKQRTEYDIEMLTEVGSCKGIENYSRYFTGRAAGEPPPTLFEYLPRDAVLFVDESHVSIPQISGAYKGDLRRKQNLIEHGFRLPSARDNRPLKREEWEQLRPQTVFVSATPAKYELGLTGGECVEQIVRPTGLIDPKCEVRPSVTQIQDLMIEIDQCVKLKHRVLVTALTKKTAEMVSSYLEERGVKASYLHSEVKTLDRTEIMKSLRRGDIDVVVGVNLLREGLDIPECGLVAILDADQRGFLRSETSLIQIIGRAARNMEGRVILYADKMTPSMESAMRETERRRQLQLAHNKRHNITPMPVRKAILETPGQGAGQAAPKKSKAGKKVDKSRHASRQHADVQLVAVAS